MALFEPFRLFARRHGVAPVLAIVAACAPPHAIKIGLSGNFEDAVDAPMRLGARLAVDEINARGGVGGRPLELVEREDHADPDSAVVVAEALMGAGVVAVIGPSFSGPALAAAPVYNGGRDPVVHITTAASSPEVSSSGPYTFRICPSDLAHGDALARWARQRLSLERGAVLYLNNDYGRGVRQTFVRRFTELDGHILESDPFLGGRPDVGAYLDRLLVTGRPQFLIVAGYRDDAIEILRQARERKLRIPILGGDGLDGIETAGALAEGAYVSAAYLPSLGTFTNRAFIAAYQRKFPAAGRPNQSGAGAYDAVYLLREVIARVGTKRAAIREGLAAVGSSAPSFDGVTGRIAFDSLGDVPTRQVYIGVIRGGEVLPAGGL